ncbi:hypothetical protein J3F84DRAFT_401288 [Trichoderma pleuroticola]
MRDIIRRLDYVVSHAAKNAPLFHTLIKAEYKKLQEGVSLSWAVFIILKTVYGDALPTKYVDCIRDTIGETELDNHTDEYLAIMATSTEPTEPSPKSKKPRVVEISSSSTLDDDDTSGDEDDGEGDRPTSPRQAEVPQHADGRDGSALNIGDESHSTNGRTGTKSPSSPMAESNSANRRDPTPVHSQTGKKPG